MIKSSSHSYIKTLHSIDAPSQNSYDENVAYNNDLLVKLLMMSIELQRKDAIIAEFNEYQHQIELDNSKLK